MTIIKQEQLTRILIGFSLYHQLRTQGNRSNKNEQVNLLKRKVIQFKVAVEKVMGLNMSVPLTLTLKY